MAFKWFLFFVYVYYISQLLSWLYVFIYKDSPLHSLEDRKRTFVFVMKLLTSELQLRMKIYEQYNMILHVKQIIHLLSFLCDV